MGHEALPSRPGHAISIQAPTAMSSHLARWQTERTLEQPSPAPTAASVGGPYPVGQAGCWPATCSAMRYIRTVRGLFSVWVDMHIPSLTPKSRLNAWCSPPCWMSTKLHTQVVGARFRDVEDRPGRVPPDTWTSSTKLMVWYRDIVLSEHLAEPRHGCACSTRPNLRSLPYRNAMATDNGQVPGRGFFTRLRASHI